MKQPKKSKLYRLNIRLSEEEWNKIHRLYSRTTCRSISEYARKVLSAKPVNVFYRNQSFDNLEEQITQYLPQLKTIGNNLDELVQKPDIPVPELKESLSALKTFLINCLEQTKESKDPNEKPSDPCDQI